MRKVHIVLAFLLGMAVVAPEARSQTAWQQLSFSILARYETNLFGTNAYRTTTNVVDSEVSDLIVISSANIVKALALDIAGSNWANLANATLVRETDFTNGVAGADGIFLYQAKPPTNVNVSSFFTFSNNFTADVTNHLSSVAGFDAGNPPNGGVIMGGVTNTNSLTTAGLFYVAMYTTNMQFDLIGYGSTTTLSLKGVLARTNLYTGWVQTVNANGVGTYGVNVTTNLLGPTVVATTNFVSGPAHGTFITSGTSFITNAFGH